MDFIFSKTARGFTSILAAVFVAFGITENTAALESSNMFCLSTEGSERATTGPGNLIATWQGKTHVVWQESTTNGYFNRVRTLDHPSGVWSPTVTLNKAYDNHARPVITVDSKGFLHVILGGHNTPVTYRQSKRPNDSSDWTEPVTVGIGTYAVLVCGADDTLFLTLRAKQAAGMDFYVKHQDKRWERPIRLIERLRECPGYAGFANGMALSADRRMLHMVCDFYEGRDYSEHRGTHQAVAYMRSPDQGKTWQKADGSPIAIPARPETMDKFAQDIRPRREPDATPVIGSGGAIFVDSSGRPSVLYKSYLKEPGELILAQPNDKGQWQQRTIDAIPKSMPGFRGTRMICTINDRDVWMILSQVMAADDSKLKNGAPTRAMRMDESPGNMAVWLISRDGGKTFEVQPLLPANSQARRCEFNIERPTGVNRIAADKPIGVLFFEGLVRYAKEGETIQNKVFWLSVPPAASRQPAGSPRDAR